MIITVDDLLPRFLEIQKHLNSAHDLSWPRVRRQAFAGKDEDEKGHGKTNEGKKLPWEKAQQAAKEDPIDWALVNLALPRSAAMSNAVIATKDKVVRDAADGYVAAVNDLAAQANKRDAVRTRAAVALELLRRLPLQGWPRRQTGLISRADSSKLGRLFPENPQSVEHHDDGTPFVSQHA